MKRAAALALAVALASALACERPRTDELSRDAGTAPAADAAGSLLGAASSAGPPNPSEPGAVPCKLDADRRVEDGRVVRCNLARDHAVGPYTCVAERPIALHPSGALASCTVAGEISVSGYTCAGALALDASGRLARCRLARPAKIPALELLPGDFVTIGPGGGVRRVERPGGGPLGTGAAVQVSGLRCQGLDVELHEGKGLARCVLAERATVGGRALAAFDEVCLEPSGAPLPSCSDPAKRARP